MVPVVQILANSFCSRLTRLVCTVLHSEEVEKTMQRESVMHFIVPETPYLDRNSVDNEA